MVKEEKNKKDDPPGMDIGVSKPVALSDEDELVRVFIKTNYDNYSFLVKRKKVRGGEGRA